MPVVSQAQNRLMEAAAHGDSRSGVPEAVGKEFVAATPPGAIKSLPQHVGPSHEEDEHTQEARARADHLHKHGMISDEAHKRLHESISKLHEAARPAMHGGADDHEVAGEGGAEEDGERPSPDPKRP